VNIISFSGGADSTAVLVYCKINNIPFEEIIYMEDWYPYPDKEFFEYFDYIEKIWSNEFKITRLKCDKLYWIKKNGGHHPRLPYPYCCRVKSQIFAEYCKEKYGKSGITIIMGLRKYESNKRSKYINKGKWYWNKRFGVDYDYWYPIFKFRDSKMYLNYHGCKINPLYDIYGIKRLGCKVCYKTGELRWKGQDEQQKYLMEWL
jgi:3'-phosphoadenosine 5'-phosphosulfate sulfotransferase (PAPS reductase)/FAD synthetase